MELFKISDTDGFDFYTHSFRHEVGCRVVAPDWDPDPSIDCGAGFHFCESVERIFELVGMKPCRIWRVFIPDSVLVRSPGNKFRGAEFTPIMELTGDLLEFGRFKIMRENSSAELLENSSAVLWGNSSAVLWGNSSAELLENSSAVLWGNSRAVLMENSRAVLWENSRAVLWGNSRAVLRGNSRAEIFSREADIELHDDAVAVDRTEKRPTVYVANGKIRLVDKSASAAGDTEVSGP